METVFLEIVNRSLSAGVLVLAVLLARFLFRRMPKWAMCLLWALVALRLAFPELPQSSLSLQPTAQALPQEILYTARPQIQSGVEIVDELVNPALASSLTPFPGASANPTQIWSFLLSRLWLLGLGAMVLYLMVSTLLLKWRVASAVPLEKGVKTGEMVETPFVFGILRPTIYLPSGLDEKARGSVLAHERSHIRRLDQLWKPLGYLLLSVYWFHPLMWLAYILLCRDIEAACDERVIRDLSIEERREYSRALLLCSLGHRHIAACPLAFGEVGVKARIKGVMDYKKPGFWLILLALALCGFLAVGFLTDPDGMALTEIDDSRNYSDLFQNPGDAALVRGEKRVRPWAVEELLSDLEGIQVRPVTLLRTRSENRDKTNRIYLRGNTYVNFSANYRRVWIDNGVKATYTYTVVNPGYVREIFEKYWNPVPLTTWFLEDGAYSDQQISNVPGLRGYTFSCTSDHLGHRVRAEKDGESRVILSGWPIQNAFFYDLTGDQSPELCVTASFGFGMIDQRVLAYDLAARETYELEARGICNYHLYEANGVLMAQVTSCATGERWGSGEVLMDLGSGQLCVFGEDLQLPEVPEDFKSRDSEKAYLNREAGGEPFAAQDAPWDWCRFVHPGAIRMVTLNGYENSAMSQVALEGLLSILNGLPRSAFRESTLSDNETTYRFCRDSETMVTAIFLDHANELAVYLHYEGGKAELMLSQELDRVTYSNTCYLPGLQVWEIDSQDLRAYMEKMLLNHPGIHITLKQQYDWQEPVTAEIPGGQLIFELMEGWEYELCTGEAGGGIRVRPQGEEGWYRLAFWEGEYDGRQRDRELEIGSGRILREDYGIDLEYITYRYFLEDVPARFDRTTPWAYEVMELEQGDLVRFNEGAAYWPEIRGSEWFAMEYLMVPVLP